MPQIMRIHRVNGTNKIRTLVFISLLLFLAHMTLVECASLVVSLGIRPTRWDMPSPLEFHGRFNEQVPINGPFTLSMWSTLTDLTFTIPILGPMGGCYAVLDDSRTVQVTQEEPEQAGHMKIAIQNVAALTQFYVRCQDVVLGRPSTVDPTIESTSTRFVVTNTFASQTWTTPVDIVQHPTVIHQYLWKSQYRAAVAVKFSFYRPSTMSDVSEFYLDHPLLQVKRITSTHLAPDTSYLEDLRRPYNLLTRYDYAEGITCYSANESVRSSLILFHRDPASDEVIPVVRLPTTADGALPDQPYICSFTIDYPADVISASMYSLEDVNEELKVTIRRRSDGVSFTNIPLGVPLIIPYTWTTTAPPGVFVWHSPHHLHENMMEFEIAIAMSSLYYTGESSATLSIIPSLQTAMTLQITLQNANPTLLLEWWATINCRRHHSLDVENTPYNDIIDLTAKAFYGLGQVCRVTLKKRPGFYPPNTLYSIAIHPVFIQDSNFVYNLVDMTIFDTFHTFKQTMNWFYLQDTSYLNTHMLPWKPPSIPLTTYKDAISGKTYTHVSMNLQYLLSYPTRMTASMFLFHFAFNRGSELLKVVNGNNEIITRVVVQKTSSSYTVLDTEVILTSSPVNFWNTLPEDPEYITVSTATSTTAFHPGRSLRVPRLTTFNLSDTIILENTQPLRITFEWELPPGAIASDIDGIMVYPFLLSTINVVTSTFPPQYALITPVRPTPLAEYSYRCVEWDHIAAPYAYEKNTQLTTENSFVCPQYTHREDLDPAIWRRLVFHRPLGAVECFYELAAVCVTPSSTVEGVYDTHPLADCPSFLGAMHAIPCSLVDDEPPAWSYYLSQMYAILSPPELDENDLHKKRSITLGWSYVGDPRLTLTVAIKPLVKGRDNDDPYDTRGWVALARDIPAALSPKPVGPGFTIGFPILNPEVDDVFIRLTLNGVPGVEVMLKVGHDMAEAPNGGIYTGCSANYNKMFDRVTQLCRCMDGFTASGSTDIDRRPMEFACTSVCDESKGFQWHAIVGRCVDEDGNVVCDNHGVWSPSFQRCVCMTGYYGDYCQYDDTTDPTLVCDELQCVTDHTMKDSISGDGVISDGECEFDNDLDSDSSSVVCNCADGFTGDQCQHQAVCGVRQCVNGRLISPTGKPEQCKCECNSANITGSACNQCTLPCRNGGVANTQCAACKCPAGYIGMICTIPVWYHTFTLRNLPQHIVELILGTTASDKEEMAILQQTMVKYLLEDYSRVLSETFIVVDGNDDNGNPDDNDTRIRVRVELSQFQTVIPPANPNAPYVHIQLMLYPADMTEEMLAYALQHGLDFDWSRVTDNLEFFRKFLREQGIIDDDSSLTPDIDDPGCTTRECREKIIEEESSNNASPSTFTLALALSISMSLVALLPLLYA